MTSERWAQIEDLFHRAAECDADGRIALLDQACRNDPDLRQHVEALLSGDKSAAMHLQAVVGAELQQVAFPLAGKIISHYRILEGLASGGMGLVYRAQDLKLPRSVALKFLPPELAQDPQALQRFRREAYAASALNHSNICTVYDVDEFEGRPFIVMELLEGQTLERRIANAPIPTSILLDIVVQVCEALEVAHSKGVIHRDIKPSNIFVSLRGQAKLLDFGLAKRTHVRNPRATAVQDTISHRSNLTLPGAAIGTVAYMSPEQARGEELDSRTDLFSFGAVLYEMATGKPPFSGNTSAVIFDAILNRAPTPFQSLNVSVPEKLADIIGKLLKKDRNLRYQTASEVLAELKQLKHEGESGTHLLSVSRKTRQRKWGKTLVIPLLPVAVAILVFRFARFRPSAPPELRLTQLTSNSVELPIGSGKVSPDGKYLLFSDSAGIHIRMLDTGEVQTVSVPEGLRDRARWEVGPWFPDSARFLVNSHPLGYRRWTSSGSTVWMASVLGGVPRRIRDEATAYSISPDGSLIAFGAHPSPYLLADQEIWLMDPTGDHVRKLAHTEGEEGLVGLNWSPDRQRMLYLKFGKSGYRFASTALTGYETSFPIALDRSDRVLDFCWLPDGRLVYAIGGQDGNQVRSNFWQVQVAPRTGMPTDSPKPLTNWAGFWLGSISASADGKRLVFRESTRHGTVYLADSDSRSMRLSNFRHLILNEGSDWPGGWTPDGKAVVFNSDVRGRAGIYQQSLDSGTPRPIIMGSNDLWIGAVTPDGAWLLYVVPPRLRDGSQPYRIMRVAMGGGSPELVLETSQSPAINCPIRGAGPCVLYEQFYEQLQTGEFVVSSLDPFKGRGKEHSRLKIKDATFVAWDLAPDGKRFAFYTGTQGPIRIISLRGEPEAEVPLKGWSGLGSLNWSSDGKGVYVCSTSDKRVALLYATLQGTVRVLWEQQGGLDLDVVPSPDGRHVAIQSELLNSNLWMMENF